MDDPERAADHFFHTLKGELQFRAMINLRVSTADADIKRHVADCVDMFLRAYGGTRRYRRL